MKTLDNTQVIEYCTDESLENAHKLWCLADLIQWCVCHCVLYVGLEYKGRDRYSGKSDLMENRRKPPEETPTDKREPRSGLNMSRNPYINIM